jgi:hypothetical protein
VRRAEHASDSPHVVCADNEGYAASLEPRKIYWRLVDQRAEDDGMIRVIDESGEDHLFSARCFALIVVPHSAERVFSDCASRKPIATDPALRRRLD